MVLGLVDAYRWFPFVWMIILNSVDALKGLPFPIMPLLIGTSVPISIDTHKRFSVYIQLFTIFEYKTLKNSDCLAKQDAKSFNRVIPPGLCMQVDHCLAPAFFLIGMLNLASATSIIASKASARSSSCFSAFLSLDTSALRDATSSATPAMSGYNGSGLFLLGTFFSMVIPFSFARVSLHIANMVTAIGINLLIRRYPSPSSKYILTAFS